MEYSIGDIVKVIDYGSRVCNQEHVIKVFGKLFHLTSDLPFNIDNEINKTDYRICDKKYANMEWKIIDCAITSFNVILRLRTRTKYDMLLIYDTHASLQIVRKSKKRTIIKP